MADSGKLRFGHYLELATRLLGEAVTVDDAGLGATLRFCVARGWSPIPLTDGAPPARFDACTGCEACNLVCPLVAAGDVVVFSGPMDIPLRHFRAAPDFHAARRTLEVFKRCGPCRACEATCPQQVPILELVDLMRRTLAANDASDQAETNTTGARQ